MRLTDDEAFINSRTASFKELIDVIFEIAMTETPNSVAVIHVD